MFGNPLTNQELLTLAQASAEQKSPGLNLPEKYILATPVSGYGFPAYRLFDAAYISTGIIDPNRLGTGAVGAGNLYLADDGTWKAVSGGGGGSQNLQSVTDLGNTTTNTIDTAGTKSDYFLLDTLATPTLQPGMFGWDDAYGTADLRLKGNNVTLQLGQEILARVVNKTGANLLESEYKVVRVRIASEGGAQGQRLAVVLAQGNNDPDSVTTLGIVTENINNNEEGFITILGNVNGINTTGSLQGETWVDGDVLYLSPSTPGGLTKVKPTAPNHTVTVGYVVYAHSNQGKIFVKVDNGYELDELHNVLISSASSGQLLRYNGSVWENWTPNFLTTTPTLAQVTTAGNTTTNAITVGGLTVDTNVLVVDPTNDRVGFGTTSPAYRVDVQGFAASDAVRSYIGFDLYTVPEPTSLSAVVSAGGSVDTGLHGYYITFITALGETRGYGPLSVTTTAGNNTVTLTIPVSSDPRVTGRKIYRTKVGSIYNEYIIATINNNTATTYVDTVADSTLTQQYRGAYIRANTTNNQFTINGQKAMLLDVNATYFGLQAGQSITSGGYNVFVGYRAGYSSTTGLSNTFIGFLSASLKTTGDDNVVIGTTASYNATTLNRNVVLGTLAGRYHTGGSANITTMTNSVFIGMRSYAASATPSNTIVIGYLAESLGDNTVVLGNSSIVTTALRGNVLINTTTDAGFKLDVNGTARVQGQLTVLNSDLVIPVNEGWTSGGEILLTRPGAARTAVRIGRSSGGSGDDGEIELFRDGVSLFRFSGTADNYINPTGLGSKLGIGTTSPAYRVDVQGTTLVDSTVSVQGAFNINPLAAPPSIAGYTLSAGTSLGVGRYYYFVTYVTAIGETNAGSNLIVDTTTGNTTVNLTGIPVSSDPRVTARKIYRTKVGGTSDNQFFLATINNNTTTTYTDSIADASLPGVGAQLYKVNTTARYFTVSGVQGMVIDPNLTAIGRNAGSAIITNSAPAVRTVLVGAQAGQSITTGQGNVIVGVAGISVTTGGSNTLIGDLAGYVINTGYSNTIIGSQSGRFLTTGYRNTMVGNDTGRYLADGTTQFTSGADNTILGGNIRMFAANDANSIVIGYDARGLGSNTTVLGNSSITFTAIPAGNMTIGGTVNAGFKLDVQGTIRSTDVITASGGTSTDWNTAFSWGNHASAGYVTTGTAQTITGVKSFARTLNIVRTIAATDDVNTVLNQNTLVSSGFILNGATNAPISGNLQYVNIGAYTLASLDNNSTSIYIRKLYSPTNFTAWERLYVESFHPEADKWTTARTITIGNTGKSVDGTANVSWTIAEIGALSLAAGGTVNVNAANGTALFVGSTGSWSNRGPANNNAGALLSLNTHPGDYYSQFWFDTGAGSFYYRTANGVLPTGTWQRVYQDNYHPLADQLTTARQINGTSFNGSADITTANWGTARTITIGGTGKSVNGSGNVTWNHTEMQTEYQIPNNTGRGTLTDPTLREIALSHATMSNKIRFIAPTSQEESTDGTTWTASTRATADQLGDLVRGEGEGTYFTMIPGGTIGTYGGYRLTWDVVGTIGYVFFNHLYMFLETRSNPVNVLLERYHNTTGWEVLTGPHVVNNWPGHFTIPHTSTPYSGSATQYSRIRITFSSTRTNTNDMVLNAVEWYGTYPNQKRNVESYDRNKNATFPAGLRASEILINTSVSSGYNLDVNGPGRFSHALTINTPVFGSTQNQGSLLVTAASGDTRNFSVFLGSTAVYNPASNTNTVAASLAGIRFDWYTENWMISATRGGGSDIKGLLFSRNGVERMVIDSNGHIGVGTTTPAARFHIRGDQTTVSLNSTTPTGVSLIASNSDPLYGAMIGTYSTGAGALQQRRTNAATYYDFYLQPHGGNVGIGNTSPSEKLHVSGKIRQNNGGDLYLDANVSSTIISSLGARPLHLEVNGSNRLTAYSSGNVGIGTSTDAGYKLDVIGTIRSTAVITALGGDSNNWNTAYGWGDHAAAGYAAAFMGYTGIVTFPSNPPGQQNFDFQNGILVNVF